MTAILSRAQLLALGLGAAGAALTALPAHAAPAALPAAASLGPLINVPQTWNNCGPAAISEVLAYWGVQRSQYTVQSALRVEGSSAGMTSYGVPAYARSLGMRAFMGVGGNEALIKRLVAAGFPVIVHQIVSYAENVGHYRPVESYNDSTGIFTVSDPLLGGGYQLSYAAFSALWAYRAGQFFVIYPAAKQHALTAVLAAAGYNQHAAYVHDLALVSAGQVDVAPTAGPAPAAAYRYLALAWDSVYLKRPADARRYLAQATAAGANAVEVGWITALI